MAAGRRSSNVGEIGLGDNATPSLSTMRVPFGSAKASQQRQRALSGEGMDLRSGRKAYIKDAEPAQGPYRAWLLYREFAYRNTWLNPLLILVSILSWFAYTGFDTESWIHPFVCLSYRVPGSSPAEYGKGLKDYQFVFFYMIFFTFFREFCMIMILAPIAKHCGITKKTRVYRFMEQTYSIIYYSLSGSYGIYIMYHSSLWYFNTTEFYVGYPHLTNALMMKSFYLLQAAFWAQQSVVLILQLEKPRKDFNELIFHHIITMSLIFLSYRFHFTKIGVAVYITMDVADWFLAMSKTLNYLDSPLTPPFFFIFATAWIYMRHYQNLRFLYSILTEFKTVGDFTLNWETQQYKCWISQYITFALLLALQLVNCYWLFLILRIAYRMTFQNVIKDDRSSDEESDDEEQAKERKDQ